MKKSKWITGLLVATWLLGSAWADAAYHHEGEKDANKFLEAYPAKTGTKLVRGMTHDGLGIYLSKIIEKAPGQTANIVKILRDTGTRCRYSATWWSMNGTRPSIECAISMRSPRFDRM